jgi:molybdopterin converting factor small subunit
MDVKILIPTPLRQYTEKNDSVTSSGNTVGEVLQDLTSKYSQLQKHLFNERGELRSYVNIYVNDEDIRYIENTGTQLKRMM